MKIVKIQAAFLEYIFSHTAAVFEQANYVSPELLVVTAFGFLCSARFLDQKIQKHHELAYNLALLACVARLVVGLFANSTIEAPKLFPLLVQSGLIAAIAYGATRSFLGASFFVSNLTKRSFEGLPIVEAESPEISLADPVPAQRQTFDSDPSQLQVEPNQARRSVYFGSDESKPLHMVFDETQDVAFDDLFSHAKSSDRHASS